MNSKETDISASTMVALRAHVDALKAITEKLRVREMGPADHIRTKHEVKAWLEAGGAVQEAEAILARSKARRELQETHRASQTVTQRQQRGQRLDD